VTQLEFDPADATIVYAATTTASTAARTCLRRADGRREADRARGV